MITNNELWMKKKEKYSLINDRQRVGEFYRGNREISGKSKERIHEQKKNKKTKKEL